VGGEGILSERTSQERKGERITGENRLHALQEKNRPLTKEPLGTGSVGKIANSPKGPEDA